MAMVNTRLARPAGCRRHTKLGRKESIGRAAASTIEALESRVLLAVSATEYTTIRGTYPGFDLPADMASINIIEVTPDQLTVAKLQNAVAAAAATTLPDLVVLRTTDAQNTITYANWADPLKVDIPAAQGAITILSLGSRPLTLDGAGQWQVLSVGGSSSSTTSVNLGGLVLTHGKSSNGGGLGLSGGSLRLADVAIIGNEASSLGGGLYQSGGTLGLTNVMISGNSVTSVYDGSVIYEGVQGASGLEGYGGGAYLSGGTSTLTNVTVVGNTASRSGGGLYLGYDGVAALYNTIIARNVTGYRSGSDVNAPDVLSEPATLKGANNLIGDGTGQISLIDGTDGNQVGTMTSPIDPGLAEGTSAGIGLAPLPGSPAIDAGDDSLVPAGIAMDLYGAPRIQGTRVNIGAVETVLPDAAGVIYVVNSLADDIGADGVVTLREALAAANSNQVVGDAPAGSYSSPDRIEFAPGLAGTILTNGHAYEIRGSVTIAGSELCQLALDAQGTSRVVDIRGGYDVNLCGMTIAGGKTSYVGFSTTYGGGIYACGPHLTLDQLADPRQRIGFLRRRVVSDPRQFHAEERRPVREYRLQRRRRVPVWRHDDPGECGRRRQWRLTGREGRRPVSQWRNHHADQCDREWQLGRLRRRDVPVRQHCHAGQRHSRPERRRQRS